MGKLKGHYAVAKVDIHTKWGLIKKGTVGRRIKQHFVDFGGRFPITAFDEEIRDATHLEALAAQAE